MTRRSISAGDYYSAVGGSRFEDAYDDQYLPFQAPDRLSRKSLTMRVQLCLRFTLPGMPA